MMYSNLNRMKNIEIPENLFSNLGESKKPKIVTKNEETNLIENQEEISDYRKRITNMYENLEDLTPINNEIDDMLYFNNYVERGIVIKPKISSLKQFWTEYRLIKNEKDLLKEDTKEIIDTSTSNFDDLFNTLSERVLELNKYIDELKEMKTNIDKTNNKLEQDSIDLKEEKQKFMDYKKEEEKKLAKEKETLKLNYDRLQNIINDLDKKLNEIEK